MKIPTLFGIFLLITALALGAVLFYLKKNQEASAGDLIQPQNIIVANLSANQATVTWQTNTQSKGAVSWGEGKSLQEISFDDREGYKDKSSFVHFVSLKNLKPKTQYSFKVKSDKFSFPKDQPIEFKTASEDDSQTIFYKPLIGSILDYNLKPVPEALIILNVADNLPQASISDENGNFLLAVNNLRNKALIKQSLDSQTPAVLVISLGDIKSNISLTLPFDKSFLPPIILGQDLDISSQIAKVNIDEEEIPSTLSDPLDLNGDGKINALDVSIIFDNYGKNPEIKEADLNSDGVVDNQDLQIIKKGLNEEDINQLI